jgi:hypothetical protein
MPRNTLALSQPKFFVEQISALKGTTEWRRLSERSKGFVEDLAAGLAESKKSATGDKGQLKRPFTDAVRRLLIESGHYVDSETQAVHYCGGSRKSVDISSTYRNTRHFWEIKTCLEANHLGAALFEALIFKSRFPNSRFYVVSLYAKNRSTSTPALGQLLNELGVGNAIDKIVILTKNHADDYCGTFAEGVQDLARSIRR